LPAPAKDEEAEEGDEQGNEGDAPDGGAGDDPG
jgi:hypothetical protein